MITTIGKWGNSGGVRIPKNILNKYGLGIDSEIELVETKEGLLLQKVKRHKTLKERLKGYPDDVVFTSEDVDGGEPVGEEVW